MDINEYISTQMNGKIERRGNSPLAPAIITVAGAAILLLTLTAHTFDSLQATLLSIGFLVCATGLLWVILCLSKTLWHYYYLTSSSPMRKKTIYLSAEEYHRCTEMLTDGHPEDIASIRPVPSSNNVLHLVYSRDLGLVLLQTGRMDTSRLEPNSQVVALTGSDATTIAPLLR